MDHGTSNTLLVSGEMRNRPLICTFGSVKIYSFGKFIPLKNLKARALIVFLYLGAPSDFSRLELCDMFWPEVDEQKARASLRQCLASIRRTLGPLARDVMVLESERVGLNSNATQTDFGDLLARLERPRPDKTTFADSLNVKRILEDVMSVSSNFETWARAARSDAVDKVLDRLKAVYMNSNHDIATRLLGAQTSLKLNEFEEDAVRAAMTALYENGESSAALRLYGKFFNQLADEMDSEPSIETQELAVDIKLGAESQTKTTPRPRFAAAKPVLPAVTMAVLPFEIYGALEQRKEISLTLLEHLTCHLASFKAPSIISSNTTRMYLDQAPRPAIVGKHLNTRYLLTGSVRLDNGQAALTVQLIEAKTERVVWATTMVSSHRDILKLNIPIAEKIARAIVPSVDAEELRFSRMLPDHELEPYHLILQAKDLIFKLVQGDFLSAGRLPRKAVDIGPQFAPAHSMMADWLSIALWEGWSQDNLSDRAALDQHARKAIALSPGDGRVMALWAHNRMMFEREYDASLALLDNAIKLSPNDAEALAWSVPTLTTTRNSDQAVLNGRKAIELSPCDPFIFRNEHFLSFALYANGDYDQSAEYGLSSFRRAPNYSGNLRATIAALCAAGRQAETIPLVEHHTKITPEFSVEDFQKVQGFRYPEDRQKFAEYLLDAGLPA